VSLFATALKSLAKDKRPSLLVRITNIKGIYNVAVRNVDSTSNNVADSVGLMVYEGTEALRYVDNYAKGAEQWEGFPIRVNVPRDAILLGCKGVTASQSIVTLADESIRQDLLGVMVWYASVRNGFQYEISWDASTSTDSQHAYVSAMQNFNAHMGK
jgi:hypothetical protein